MTKQLSEKQKAKLREAIQDLREAQEHLDNMGRIIDQIEQEEARK